MDVTILVAKILAIYLVVSGLFLIIRGKTVVGLMRDFFDHPSVSYLTGIILIFLSSMYLLQFSIWSSTLHVIVSIFVWLVLIKGLTYIFIPRILDKIAVRRFRKAFAFYGVIAVLVGVYIFFAV